MNPISRPIRSLGILASSAILAGALSGCGAGVFKVVPPGSGTGSGTGTGSGSGTGGTGATSFPGVAFTGKVMAGSLPVIGSSVKLYAAGTSGNGSAPVSLLASAVKTDSTGSFSIPAGYPCPASASQLYAVASGGTAGPLATENSFIAFFTALGTCGQLSASSAFVLNEATTAAAAWSLAQFLAPGGQLGASATNAQGLANAVAGFNNLVNPATGSAPGAAFPSTGGSPAPRVNSFANLLNSCASAASIAPCSQLAALTASSGSTPADTLDAALSLARHPGINVAALYTQSASSHAFAPALTSAPADWTLVITYGGGGMKSPSGLGVTSSGNVWVASYFSVASQFSPTGQPLAASGYTAGALANSYGLAVDAHDNAWIPNEASPYSVNNSLGSVTELNSSGQPLSGDSGYSTGGIYYPIAVAIDPNATAWVLDYGNSHLTQLNASGQPLSGAAGFTSSQFSFPVAIALDANHNAWVANQADVTVTKVSPDGTQFSSYSCCNAPSALAIDQTGHVWVANYYGASISELAADGTVLSTGYTGGGLDHPQSIAIDGSGTVWVSSFRSPSLTEFAGASSSSPGQLLSPASGWASDSGLVQNYALAIDASGNLWVTAFGSNLLAEYVGLATPVKTPQLGPPQLP